MSELQTRGALRVRDRVLHWGVRTYIMGIVNVSPDSFSGDGSFDGAAALARAHELGASIIVTGSLYLLADLERWPTPANA